MLYKRLFVALAVLLPLVVPGLHGRALGFELFPRPEGQYTVQRGDTLFGIAGYYYTNPALWPFLWNQNPAIKITDRGGAPENQPLVPGTKINLFHTRTPAAIMNETYNPPNGVPDDLRYFVTEIPYKGIPYDKKYFRYKLSRRATRLLGYIVASPEVTKTRYLERDLVYIRFRPSKKQAILVGDRFGIYRDRGPLFSPVNPNRPVGHLTEVVGEVEITSTGHELATAIILESFVDIGVGDKICLYAPRPREIVPSKTHRMLTGSILVTATRDDPQMIHANYEGDIVVIDRGECDGMKEGLLLNIYRPSHPVEDPFFPQRLLLPDRFVGEGMVLKAFDKTSTVLINATREEVFPGDMIKSVSD